MATASTPSSTAERTEIAFFDVETSAPTRCALLEFGAILVCPRRLVEVSAYATLVRPADPDAVPAMTARCNGITRDAIAAAPLFRDVADDVYGVLHGRVWAGHNILRFDSVVIREAFTEIARPPPEPKGMIDTLPLLIRRFGTRAGDMKLASLANYFGLGRQRHRSLDDVRMNLEVLKCCATVLFLETSPPEVPTVENLLEGPVTRNLANGATSPDEMPIHEGNSSHDSPKRRRMVSPADNATSDGDNHGTGYPATNRESGDLVTHVEEMSLETTMQMDASSSGYSEFVKPDDVSTECIKISLVLLHQFGPRTVIQHKGIPLQLCCAGLKVRFGVSAKFLGNAGRPKLNIMVDIPENLSKVLEFCDHLAQMSSPEAGGTSEWRPLVKKYGHANRPTVRLNIPTVISGDIAIYSTDICKKESNGIIQKIVFSKVDAAELDFLLRWNKVDAFILLEIYDYKQNAGIRLIAKRLVVHSR